LLASASVANPQSFNRYTYVVNNPANLTDPTGLVNSHGDSMYPWEEDRWGDIPWSDAGQKQPGLALPYVGDGIVQSGAGETPADEGIAAPPQETSEAQQRPQSQDAS